MPNVSRSDTASRSFRLSRNWWRSNDPADTNQGTTLPATPGAFDYISVNDNAATFQMRPLETSPLRTGSPDTSEDDIPLPTRKNEEKNRKSFHSKCSSCWSRLSLCHLFAALLCVVGGGIFTVYVKWTCDMMMQSLAEVMHVYWKWIEAASISVTAAGAIMMTLSLLVFIYSLVVGNDAKIEKIDYDEKQSIGHHLRNPSSRYPPLIFMLILYPAFIVWLFLFAVSVAFTYGSMILNGVCNTEEIWPLWHGINAPDSEICDTILEGEDCINCIDLYQFHFLFPPDTRKEDMWVCGSEIWQMCATDLPAISDMWVFCLAGSTCVVFGITLHLVALTHTRTRLGEEKTMREKLDLKYIQERVNKALTKKTYEGEGKGRGRRRKRKEKSEVDRGTTQKLLMSKNNTSTT